MSAYTVITFICVFNIYDTCVHLVLIESLTRRFFTFFFLLPPPSTSQTDVAETFLADILKAFMDQFQDNLSALRPKFDEASKNPEQANLDLSFMTEFDSFQEVVEKLADEL